MNQRRLQFFTVLGIGLLAVFLSLDISLFVEDEGLYAAIIDQTFKHEDPFHLDLYGETYLNKPPLFFWMESVVSTNLAPFFESLEVALRLPESLFSLGTLLLTYHLGVLLFSPLAGFWAGVAVATTYLFYWYGRLVLMDPGLTFFMTAGVYCWARAYFFEKQDWWYVVGFVSLAVGTMFKAPHALLLPCLVFLVFFWWERDWCIFRRWAFYFGSVVFLSMVVPYYWVLGPEFLENFFFKESLGRVLSEPTVGNEPFFYYLIVVWFDFFPWSVLFPSMLVLLWSARLRSEKSKELFLLVWILAYFVAFSFAHGKTERYLLPIVPPIGLAIGFFYQSVLADCKQKIPCEWLLKVLLGALCIINIFGLIAGPSILKSKWGVSIDVLPLFYTVGMTGLSGWLFWQVASARTHTALNSLGLVAVGWMLGILGFLLPGVDAAASPRTMFQETRALLPDPDDPIRAFQHWHWRGDEDLYYWQYRHPRLPDEKSGANIIGGQKKIDHAWLKTLANITCLSVLGLSSKELAQLVDQKGQIVIFMTPKQFTQLGRGNPAFKLERLRDFDRGKHRVVLVRLVRLREI